MKESTAMPSSGPGLSRLIIAQPSSISEPRLARRSSASVGTGSLSVPPALQAIGEIVLHGIARLWIRLEPLLQIVGIEFERHLVVVEAIHYKPADVPTSELVDVKDVILR